MASSNPLDQQDFSIYTSLYQLLFEEEEKVESPPSVMEENLPPPIVSVTPTEEENSALLIPALPQRVETESERQQKEQQGRAKSRVKDVIITNRVTCSLTQCYLIMHVVLIL